MSAETTIHTKGGGSIGTTREIEMQTRDFLLSKFGEHEVIDHAGRFVAPSPPPHIEPFQGDTVALHPRRSGSARYMQVHLGCWDRMPAD